MAGALPGKSSREILFDSGPGLIIFNQFLSTVYEILRKDRMFKRK